MLQSYVSSVADVVCVLFGWLCMVAMVFKCVSGCFSIILEVCFKCFNCQMYVATVVLKCFKSSLDIASLSSHLLLHHTVGSRGTGVWWHGRRGRALMFERVQRIRFFECLIRHINTWEERTVSSNRSVRTPTWSRCAGKHAIRCSWPECPDASARIGRLGASSFDFLVEYVTWPLYNFNIT